MIFVAAWWQQDLATLAVRGALLRDGETELGEVDLLGYVAHVAPGMLGTPGLQPSPALMSAYLGAAVFRFAGSCWWETQLRQEAELTARQAYDLGEGRTMPAATAGQAAAADGLPALLKAARAAETEAARAVGDLQRFAKSITSVAEAEETLDAAQAELDGVRKLQETLTLTRRFLEGAQDRVHQNIAPAIRRQG